MPMSMPSVRDHALHLDVAADLLALLHDTATEPRTDAQLEALTLAVSADLPVLLWGEPGIGKTAALNQLAEALDLPLTTVIASVHEPSDFSGLPVVGDDPAVKVCRWRRRTGPYASSRPVVGCSSWTSCPPLRRRSRPPCSGSSSSAGSARCDCRPACGSWPRPTRARRRPTGGSSARRWPTASSTYSGHTTTR